MMNLIDLPTGPDSPHIVNCVIEISKDTGVKYEYDEEFHFFKLDRSLISSMNYPASYGFLPSTLGQDGDALDILVYMTEPLLTGTVAECRVLGCLDMTDGGKKDYKLIGVPSFNKHPYNDIFDLDPMFLKVTKNFFQHYKELEGKHVEIGEWLGADYAKEVIISGQQRFIDHKEGKEVDI